MNNLKNKNNFLFKKFFCNILITLFALSGGVIIPSFASIGGIGGSGNSYPNNGISGFINFFFGRKDEKKLDDDEIKRLAAESFSVMILNATYPIGSIYMSVNDVNPATIFGGTWERWGAGRVPVGVNATQSEFSSSEMTGGSRSHLHTLDSAAAMIGSDWGRTDTLAFTARNVGNQRNTTYVLQTGNRAPEPSGRSHNTALTGTTDLSVNLQPYITCYMWKRIA